MQNEKMKVKFAQFKRFFDALSPEEQKILVVIANKIEPGMDDRDLISFSAQEVSDNYLQG